MPERLDLTLAANTDDWERDLGKAAKAVDRLADEAKAAGLEMRQGFEKEVEETDQALRDLIKTAQKSDKIRISPQSAQSVAVLRNQVAGAQKDFSTFSKAATQDSNGFTAALDKNRFVAIEGARAVDDFFAAFQTGGVAGGLRGAANNLTQIASMFGPIGALAGTAGVVLGSVLIPKLIGSGEEAEEATDKLEAFRESLKALQDEALEIELGEVAFGERQRKNQFAASGDEALKEENRLGKRIENLVFAISEAEKSRTGFGSSKRLRAAIGENEDVGALSSGQEVLDVARSELAAARTDLEDIRQKMAERQEAFDKIEADKKAKAEAALRKKSEERRAKSDREANLAKQKADKAARDKAIKDADDIAKKAAKAAEKAERERQQKIDEIASKMVKTFRDVIDAEGDVANAAKTLKAVFGELESDTKAVNAAVAKARAQAEKDNRAESAQGTLVAQAQEAKARKEAEQQRGAGLAQTQAEAIGGLTIDEAAKRRAIAIRKEGNEGRDEKIREFRNQQRERFAQEVRDVDDPDFNRAQAPERRKRQRQELRDFIETLPKGVSRRDAQKQAREEIEGKVSGFGGLESKEFSALEEQQKRDAEQFKAERGGALTRGEERELKARQKQERADLKAQQRARQRGDAPIGADITQRDSFGEPVEGEGDGLQGTAEKAVDATQEGLQGVVDAQGIFVNALDSVGGIAKQAKTQSDAAISAVQGIMRALQGSSGTRGNP